MSEQMEWCSTSGKLHRLADPEVIDATAWRPTLARCGRTITPVNYFPTVREARDYIGYQEHHFCRACLCSVLPKHLDEKGWTNGETGE